MEQKENVEFEKEGAIDIDNLNQETSIFDGQQEGNPEESQPEETKTDTDPSQEGEKNTPDESSEEEKVPFHKHPRWIERENELKDLREFKEQFSDLPEKVETLQENQKSNTTDLPSDWVHLYGSDDASRQLYEYNQKQREADRELLRTELREEREAEIQREAEETKKWDEWVTSEIDVLKSEGNSFNKNELLKVALEVQPTDEEGNISLRKSLEILELRKEAKKGDSSSRKKIAANTATTSQGEQSPQKIASTNTLRNKSFLSLAQGD